VEKVRRGALLALLLVVLGGALASARVGGDRGQPFAVETNGLDRDAAAPGTASRPAFRPSEEGRGHDAPISVRPTPALPTVPVFAPETEDRDAAIPAFRNASLARPNAPVVATRTSAAPAVLTSFAGLTVADGLADPPDPEIGVGNGFVVEMVNNAIRVWGTDGSLKATYDSAALFDASSDDVSDPRIVWDASSGRWFASLVDVGEGTVRIAVSDTADPTAGWTVYDHNAGACPDQPTIGVSSTLVVVGFGGFDLPCRKNSSSYLGGGYFVYDKAGLVSGSTAYYTDWTPDPTISPVAAVKVAEPAAVVALSSTSSLEVVTFSGVPSAAASATRSRTPATIRALSTPPEARQQNDQTGINTGDIRIHSAVEDQASRTIWIGANDGCVPKGDSGERSCLRIVAVRGSATTVDEDVGVGAEYLYYPAIAIDGSGNALVVDGFSSASSFASVEVQGITPAGALTGSVTIAFGNEDHDNPRFGDYFGAAPDGTGGAWVVGETGAHVIGAQYDWGTVVAHIAGVTGTELPPPDLTPPHVHALASSGKAGKLVRLRFTASDDSGATRENVTVYSHSVVAKRISTALSSSKAGAVYFVTWRIPAKPKPPLKFCVVALDAAKNSSAQSCARIAVST
jgi:hypothetical protein